MVNTVKLYPAGLAERRSEAWVIKLPFGNLNIKEWDQSQLSQSLNLSIGAHKHE